MPTVQARNVPAAIQRYRSVSVAWNARLPIAAFARQQLPTQKRDGKDSDT